MFRGHESNLYVIRSLINDCLIVKKNGDQRNISAKIV